MLRSSSFQTVTSYCLAFYKIVTNPKTGYENHQTNKRTDTTRAEWANEAKLCCNFFASVLVHVQKGV